MPTTNEGKLTVTCSCGHTQEIQYQSMETQEQTESWFLNHYSQRKCNVCHPSCAYCHRSGDRENMLEERGLVFCNDWCRDQSLNPTHYAEHNDITIPGFLRNWADHSYHNDTCGRSEFDLGPQTEAQETRMVCWVEHDAVEDRDDPSCSRYSMQLFKSNADGDDFELFWEGDDAAIALQWVQAAEAAHAILMGEQASVDAQMLGKVNVILNHVVKS
jgi:hypothetical protein